jgi:hypothetical protein
MTETETRHALIQINKWPALPNEARVIALSTLGAALLVNVEPTKAGVVYGVAGGVSVALALRDFLRPAGKTYTSRAKTTAQFASVASSPDALEVKPGLLARFGLGKQGWRSEGGDGIVYTRRKAPRTQYLFQSHPACHLHTDVVEADLLRFYDHARQRQHIYDGQGIIPRGPMAGKLMTANQVLSFDGILADMYHRMPREVLASCFRIAAACGTISGREHRRAGRLVNGGDGIGDHLWTAGRFVDHCRDVWESN